MNETPDMPDLQAQNPVDESNNTPPTAGGEPKENQTMDESNKTPETNETAQAEQEIDEMNAKLEELNQKLDEAREERNSLLRQRFDMKEQRRYLRSQLREAKTANNTDRADRLQQRLDELQEQLDAMDGQINDLEVKIEDISEELDQILAATADAKQTDGGKSFDYAGAQEKIESAMTDLGALLQKGFKKATEKFEQVDFGAIGENVQKTATKAAKTVGTYASGAAKTVSTAASGAAKSAATAWNGYKENGAKPGQQGNYRISGSGMIDGGCYNELTLSGSTKISSDVMCRKIRSSGALRACGSVDCSGPVRTSGSFHCDGNLTAGSLSGSGAVKVTGNVHCGDLNLPGSLTVGGSISAAEMKVSGAVKVDGDCEAESFTSSGSLNIGGLINADVVEIRLDFAQSNVASIGGSVVHVGQTTSAGFISSLIKPAAGSLTCDGIEGDEVDLTGVKAGSVRGTTVVIGSGCEIGRVEYTDTCTIADGATVGESVKI